MRWCWLLTLGACGTTGAPNLSLVYAVHEGPYLALADGGDVLYALGTTELRVFEKGDDAAAPVAVPVEGTGDAQRGDLLVDGDLLWVTARGAVAVYDISDRRSPTLLHADTRGGGMTLTRHGDELWVSNGPGVAVFDVSDVTSWTDLRSLGFGAGQPGADTPFVGSVGMVLDAPRGLVALGDAFGYAVQHTSDLSFVMQTDVASSIAAELRGFVGLHDDQLYACSRDQGFFRVPLGDDGVVGPAEVLLTPTCVGNQVGDVAWIWQSAPPPNSVFTDLIRYDLASGKSNTYRPFEWAWAEDPGELIRIVPTSLLDVVEDEDRLYLAIGDLLVLGSD